MSMHQLLQNASMNLANHYRQDKKCASHHKNRWNLLLSAYAGSCHIVELLEFSKQKA